MTPRTLMLVSAHADERLRESVAAGARPRPEYLELEEHFGVELLDWSRLPGRTRGRSKLLALRHVAAAVLSRGDHEVVFSDGEHVAIPLGLALSAMGARTRHVTLGHHLTTRLKPLLLRRLNAAGIDRILVHSRLQQTIARQRLGLADSRVAFVPYYADARFWRPAGSAEEHSILAVGKEHRDYTTLSVAVAGLAVPVHIAAGSLFSPGAVCRLPEHFSENVRVGMVGLWELRARYDSAAVVVVPLLQNDFQAGVTSILEAMAMAKPVVVSATAGQRDVVVDGETGLLVPPNDPGALRDVLRRLLADPRERRRLGENAREAVLAKYDLPKYAWRLAAHLSDLAAANKAAA